MGNVKYANLAELVGNTAVLITAIFREKGDYWISGWHNGVDIAAPANTPIKAAADGVVINADTLAHQDGFGNRVLIKHADGRASLYAHMVSAPLVKVGDKVTKGQIIGKVGGTGKKQNSYGYHLHITLLDNYDKNPNIYYKGDLLDPIKELGLGTLKISGSRTIVENGVDKNIPDLNDYYAGYPAVDIPDEEIPKADKPGEVNIKVGDLVDFVGTTHYASSNGTNGIAAKPGKAKVTIINPGADHPYHLINDGTGSTVYGWVNAEDIKGAVTSEPAAEIKVGSTVMLRRGAKTYDGGKLAAFVYDRPHIVSEIKGNRAVITFGGVVVAAVSVNDLTLA